MKNDKASAATVKSNGIDIAYDTFGARGSVPLVLIMGLAAQMIAWDEAFCAQLADRGFWVVRFDNRDIGLSTKMQQFPVPDLASLIKQQLLGEPVAAPYTLRDMAADTVGLMDALGIESANVVGASMGGAIAQEMAIHYPSRVRTSPPSCRRRGNPDCHRRPRKRWRSCSPRRQQIGKRILPAMLRHGVSCGDRDFR